MKSKKNRQITSPTILQGKKTIDSVCLLGGALSILEMNIEKGKPVTRKEIKELKRYLSTINGFTQKVWKEMLKAHKDS